MRHSEWAETDGKRLYCWHVVCQCVSRWEQGGEQSRTDSMCYERYATSWGWGRKKKLPLRAVREERRRESVLDEPHMPKVGGPYHPHISTEKPRWMPLSILALLIPPFINSHPGEYQNTTLTPPTELAIHSHSGVINHGAHADYSGAAFCSPPLLATQPTQKAPLHR